MVVCVLGIVILLTLKALWFVIVYNNFQVNIVAINEAEASIDSILRKRFDLLNKAVGVIKGYIGHEKEILEDVVKLRSRKLSNIELDKELNESIKQFYEIADSYSELKGSDNFLKLLDSINDVEEQLSASRNYYNSKIASYDKRVRKFPSNMVAKLFKYKNKEFFDSNKKEKDVEIKL
ncbi:MAG: LemA family protein [Bacilli bacterium]